MLGRFLEFSIETQDIQASLDFYSKLGFSQAEVGEAFAHPYAVVTDGRICLGLHQEPARDPVLTFVKPDLLKHLDELHHLGIDFAYRHLGNDVFNEVGWHDPSGHRVRLVEARTFSPSKRSANENSLCGYFLEVGLPTEDLERSKSYWERCGFVGMDEIGARLPHVCCTSDTIDIGLYGMQDLGRPTLLFDVENVPSHVANLADRGIEPSRELPGSLRRVPAALFTAPEGTPILLSSHWDS